MSQRGGAMLSEESREQVRDSWNGLGFFYDRDDERHAWRVMGSRAGLLRFARLLERYADDPVHAKVSEHEHYGPYWYLEFMTGATPQIARHAIVGMPQDFRALAHTVVTIAGNAGVGDIVVIDQQFAQTNEYVLEIAVEADSFLPADADPQLQ